jgi:hypothetical protein
MKALTTRSQSSALLLFFHGIIDISSSMQVGVFRISNLVLKLQNRYLLSPGKMNLLAYYSLQDYQRDFQR